jgi:hypothetical protein
MHIQIQRKSSEHIQIMHIQIQIQLKDMHIHKGRYAYSNYYLIKVKTTLGAK